MRLEAKNLLIRDMTIYDAPFRNRLANHPKVRRFVRTPRRYSVDDTADWYVMRRRDKNCRLLIIEEEGAPVGYVRAQKTGADETELHVIVDPKHQGRGIATASVSALARFLRKRGSKRVFVRVQRQNRAAMRMFKRAGFKESGETVLNFSES